MDDENTLCIMFSYHPTQKFYEKSKQLFDNGHKGRETGHPSVNAYAPRPITEPYAKYWTRYNLKTAFLFNYDAQKKTWFSGLPGLWVQDAACQSGVAPIYDRSRENLGVTDTGIAVTRRLLLEAARNLTVKQQRPPRIDDPDLPMIRAVSLTVPAGSSWSESGLELMRARLGADFGYTP
jgi:hypothetical protein